MPLELGLSDAGLVVPRTADYLVAIRDDFEAATGLVIDWDNDLVLGELTAIMAQKLGEQAEVVQAIYDAFDVNNAQGVQLANLCRLVGVTIQPATRSTAVVTCEGDPGTAITIGKLVEGGGADGRARWRVTEDVLIPAGGEVDVTVEAVDAGRTVAIPGEIDAIVTTVAGWDSVTNAAAASPGADAETNDELRVRREQSIQLSAGLGLPALRAQLLALPYVETASIIDNADNEDRLVEGLLMPAHSYLAIISPDTLTTEQETEVLRLIYRKAPVSSTHAATDVVGTVTGSDGFEHEVGFDYVEEIEANIIATLVMASGYAVADASPALQVLVEAHEAGLSGGDDLYLLQLAAMAAQVEGIIGASFTINGVAADLEVTALQRVVPGSWSAA